MDLDIDNLKTIRFALAVHKDTIKPYVDVNVDGLLEDIDREIASMEPDKFMRLVDVTGPPLEFYVDNGANKTKHFGSWVTTIKYNPEWLEYTQTPDPQVSYKKEYAYSLGDDYSFLQTQMSKAHSFGDNLSDDQIEKLLLEQK